MKTKNTNQREQFLQFRVVFCASSFSHSIRFEIEMKQHQEEVAAKKYLLAVLNQ